MVWLCRGWVSPAAMTSEDRTKEELLEEARKRGIEGRSQMSKDELAEALASISARLRQPNGNWVHDHLLSLTLIALFLLSWIGQMYFQYREVVDEATQHGESSPAFFSAEFWNAFLAATFENWQSEFLQLASFVILAAYLIHRHSPQSRDGDDEMAADLKAIRQKLGA